MRASVFKISMWVIVILILVGITGILLNPSTDSVKTTLRADPPNGEGDSMVSDSQGIEGFKRADGPMELAFPRDHGAHPEYQTEWWYYTGNLETSNGRHFGYQLTFFRRALIPNELMPERTSRWSSNQVYMAHFAVSDVQSGVFHDFERFSRGTVDLAGAQSPPYQVWLYDWQVNQTEGGPYRLKAAQEGISIDLQLTDLKGPILHGTDGYSQKGPEAGNASYYISQTRLQTSGKIELEGQDFQVFGTSWMDHEFSTSALSADQVGWDWFSIQMDADGNDNLEEEPLELMVYQLRTKDGSIDPYSSGTLIYPDGSTSTLVREDFEITPLDSWQSPRSGGVYPARWVISVPSEDLELEIEPYLADQELNLSFDYWEGAVKISGMWKGQAVAGNGYAELTGYAASMAGEF